MQNQSREQEEIFQTPPAQSRIGIKSTEKQITASENDFSQMVRAKGGLHSAHAFAPRYQEYTSRSLAPRVPVAERVTFPR